MFKPRVQVSFAGEGRRLCTCSRRGILGYTDSNLVVWRIERSEWQHWCQARRTGDMLGGRSCQVKMLRQKWSVRQQPPGEWMRWAGEAIRQWYSAWMDAAYCGDGRVCWEDWRSSRGVNVLLFYACAVLPVPACSCSLTTGEMDGEICVSRRDLTSLSPQVWEYLGSLSFGRRAWRSRRSDVMCWRALFGYFLLRRVKLAGRVWPPVAAFRWPQSCC